MKKNFHTIGFIGFDFLASTAAWVIFYSVRKEILGEDPQSISSQLIINSVLIGLFWLLFYSISGYYHNIYKKSRVREFLSLLASTFLGVILIFFILLLDDQGIKKYTEYYETFGTYFLIHFILIVVPRLIQISQIKYLIKKKKLSFRTLIVGSSKKAKEIFEELKINC